MLRSFCLRGVVVASLVASGCTAPQPIAVSAPFVHVVFFKVKGGAGESAVEEIIRDVKSLLVSLPTVKSLWIGQPAPTRSAARPFVDDAYDVGLLLLFESQQGLQAYLDHPRHVEFAKKHDARCDVRVFDFSPRGR